MKPQMTPWMSERENFQRIIDGLRIELADVRAAREKAEGERDQRYQDNVRADRARIEAVNAAEKSRDEALSKLKEAEARVGELERLLDKFVGGVADLLEMAFDEDGDTMACMDCGSKIESGHLRAALDAAAALTKTKKPSSGGGTR